MKGHYETFPERIRKFFYLHAVAVLMGYAALWASGRSVPPLFFILWLIWELPWRNEDFSDNQKPQKSHLFKDRAASSGLYASGLSNAALMTGFAAIYDGRLWMFLLVGIVSAVYVFLAWKIRMLPENVHVKSPNVAGDRSKWFTLLFLGCGIVILACDTYRLSGEIPHQLQNLWPDYGEKLVEYTFAAFMCLEMTYSLRLRR